jgi:hypothetical protein
MNRDGIGRRGRERPRVAVALLGLALLLSCAQPAGKTSVPTTHQAAETRTATPKEEAGVSPTPTPTQEPESFTVQVDLTAPVGEISPFIYGMSGAPDDIIENLHLNLVSWGGNPSSRYNWEIGNAWNAGSDWYYQNTDYGLEGNVADRTAEQANQLGAAVRLALPTLGWVAKDADPATCSFPLETGGCGNADGANCSQPGAIADPTRANVATDIQWVERWVENLIADKGYDIAFFAMDNEPELWGYTHYDVHPTCTTYQEILDTYLRYATAVRQLAPNSELLGPVTCCWWFYWNSAAGEQDKAQHGNQDFLPWFLDHVRRHDEAAGLRTLDVLDIHYYPEGLYNDLDDADTQAHRLRSTRSLWDPTYVDESWIAEPIQLVPRMRELIAAHYPGTRLGISEWNFGADTTIPGALAIADALGIYGREGVYLAAYWRYPPVDSAGYEAFRMYTNYDGNGGQFLGQALRADVGEIPSLDAYAAYQRDEGQLLLMLVHKSPESSAGVDLALRGADLPKLLNAYQLADGYESIRHQELTLDDRITLPPYSITLLEIDVEA